MTARGPAVDDISAAVYVIPTDAPEADGTLVWNETATVLVTLTPDPGQPGPGLQLKTADAEHYRRT